MEFKTELSIIYNQHVSYSITQQFLFYFQQFQSVLSGKEVCEPFTKQPKLSGMNSDKSKILL